MIRFLTKSHLENRGIRGAFDGQRTKDHLRQGWRSDKLWSFTGETGKGPSEVDMRNVDLNLFVSDNAWFEFGQRNIPKLVSAVKISQYLHGDDSQKCRDVRYKFDRTSGPEVIIDQVIQNDQERQLLKELILSFKLTRSYLKDEEVRELVGRLRKAQDPETLVKRAAARMDDPKVQEELKSLWLTDLA